MNPNRMKQLKDYRIACESEATVLITGPTGSGKTRLAKQIHQGGRRRNGPFVTVNLATLHEGVLESELFGHERGAFTGADQRRVGRLEAAQGGTVFLDEIGELSPRLQARLLEFLQSRTVRSVGGNHEQRLDVRVIAATHRDLAQAVAKGGFREDLFHRLRVVSLSLPALADREEDFDEIVHSVLEDVTQQTGKRIRSLAPELAELLEAYPWPGNFRELRNVLEYAVHANQGEILRAEDLPAWFLDEIARLRLGSGESLSWEVAEGGSDYRSAMDRFERQFLVAALARTGGRISQAAREIGMSKTTLLRRLHGFAIDAKTLQALAPFRAEIR